jgi:heme-degrading monooxygenase HmoA
VCSVLEHDRLPEPDPRTWARITTFESESPEQVQFVLRQVSEQVTAVARTLPGFSGTLMLASQDRCRALLLTFWDSLEDLVASGATARELRSAGARAGVDVVSRVDSLEVILDERPT